jgi:hypothetical protein
MSHPASPRVVHIEWGRIEVALADDASRVFKDVRLYPGGAREWDWNETGMRHVPGIQVADVEELLAKGSRTIILSRGMQLVLQVPPATVEWLEKQGVRVEVLESSLAVARYNELCAHEPVGALIHSTC